MGKEQQQQQQKINLINHSILTCVFVVLFCVSLHWECRVVISTWMTGANLTDVDCDFCKISSAKTNYSTVLDCIVLCSVICLLYVMSWFCEIKRCFDCQVTGFLLYHSILFTVDAKQNVQENSEFTLIKCNWTGRSYSEITRIQIFISFGRKEIENGHWLFIYIYIQFLSLWINIKSFFFFSGGPEG